MIQDIKALERIHWRVTKYISNDFISDNYSRFNCHSSLSFDVLLSDILFLVKWLQSPDPISLFSSMTVSFSSCVTCSGSSTKLVHQLHSSARSQHSSSTKLFVFGIHFQLSTCVCLSLQLKNVFSPSFTLTFPLTLTQTFPAPIISFARVVKTLICLLKWITSLSYWILIPLSFHSTSFKEASGTYWQPCKTTLLVKLTLPIVLY